MDGNAPYPLYLHDLSQDEKSLLTEVMSLAWRAELFSQRALEKEAGFSLRYIIGAAGKPAPDAAAVSAAKADFRGANIDHAKWVWLYHYVMEELRTDCGKALRRARDKAAPEGEVDREARKEELKQLADIQRKIDRLEQQGLKSGRYDLDMHLFNLEHMYLNSRASTISEGLENDAYIGFRYDSDGEGVIVSVLRIRKARSTSEMAGRKGATASGRHVFEAAVLGEEISRFTKGIVYHFGLQLYLFGFMNDDQGGEFFALRSGDTDHRVLVGVINTTDRQGVPHAKQCVFFRMKTIHRLQDMDSDHVFTEAGRAELSELVEEFFYGEPGRWFISRAEEEAVPLEHYLQPAIIRQPMLKTRRAGGAPTGTPG